MSKGNLVVDRLSCSPPGGRRPSSVGPANPPTPPSNAGQNNPISEFRKESPKKLVTILGLGIDQDAFNKQLGKDVKVSTLGVNGPFARHPFLDVYHDILKDPFQLPNKPGMMPCLYSFNHKEAVWKPVTEYQRPVYLKGAKDGPIGMEESASRFSLVVRSGTRDGYLVHVVLTPYDNNKGHGWAAIYDQAWSPALNIHSLPHGMVNCDYGPTDLIVFRTPDPTRNNLRIHAFKIGYWMPFCEELFSNGPRSKEQVSEIEKALREEIERRGPGGKP